MLIFSLESSCDETSICIMNSDGSILSHKIASQEIHTKFGGVVPELASRSHLANIQTLYKDCLKESSINPKNIDVFCATAGPGLIGSLLVGSIFTKSLSLGFNKPFYAINHLEGHLLSPTINNIINYPYLCFLLTGGHTQIYLVNKVNEYILLGETIDDAMGEAFDKVAKLLNLSYPGGPAIEKSAKKGIIDSVQLPHPLKNKKTLDFSFSGIKTSVNLFVQKNKINENLINNVSASFQHKILEILIHKFDLTLKKLNKEKINIKQLALVGGVSINKYLISGLKEICDIKRIEIITPPKKMFGDNAAMIGWACIQKMKKTNFKSNIYFKENPRLQINEQK